MATRFYFDSVAPPTLAPPAPGTEWGHTNLAVTRRLNRTPQMSPLTYFQGGYDSAGHAVDINGLIGQFVSPPIQAQIIPLQIIKIQFAASEALDPDNLFLAWKVFLIDPQGLAKDTIVGIRRDDIELFNGGEINRSDSVTSSVVIAEQGDRICVELGAGGLPAVNGGHNMQFFWGDEAASDLPEDDISVDFLNPWIEFAVSVVFDVVAPPVYTLPNTSKKIAEFPGGS